MPCPTPHDRLQTSRLKCPSPGCTFTAHPKSPSLGCTFTAHPKNTSVCPYCGFELEPFAFQSRQIICHCCESRNNLTPSTINEIALYNQPTHNRRTSMLWPLIHISMSAKCGTCGYPLAGPENVRCWGPEVWERVAERWRVDWRKVVDEKEARRAFLEVMKIGEMEGGRKQEDREKNERAWRNMVTLVRLQFNKGIIPEIVIRRVGEKLMRKVEERGEASGEWGLRGE